MLEPGMFLELILLPLLFCILISFLLFDLHNLFPLVVNDSSHANPSSSSLKQEVSFHSSGSQKLDESNEYRSNTCSSDSDRQEDRQQRQPAVKVPPSTNNTLDPSSLVSSKLPEIQEPNLNKPTLLTSISNNSNISSSSASSSNNSYLFCHPLLFQSQQAFSTQLSHQLQQPPSINFYESYFDDSYIGDFTGEVDETRLQDESVVQDLTEVQRDWCSDPDLINPSLLEFTYDSFGPESIVFTGNNSSVNNSNNDNVHRDRRSSNHSNESVLPMKESEVRIKTGNQDINKSRSSSFKASSSVDDSEALLMSLSISEPQLSQKLSNCFDNQKIVNGYGITPFVKEEDEGEGEEEVTKYSDQLNHESNDSQHKVTNKSRGSSLQSESKSVTQDYHDEDVGDGDHGSRKRGGNFTFSQPKKEVQSLSQENHGAKNGLLLPTNPSLLSSAAQEDDDCQGGNENDFGRDKLKVDDKKEEETKENHDKKDSQQTSTVILPDTSSDTHLVNNSHNKSLSVDVVMSPEESMLSSIPSSSSSVVSTVSHPSCSSPPLSYSSSTASSDRDPSSAFASRNSTLTRSQRRKISPRLKLSQILNVSDDAAMKLMSANVRDEDNDANHCVNGQVEEKKSPELSHSSPAREVILSVADIPLLHHHNNHLLLGNHLHSIHLDSETTSSSDTSDFLGRVPTPNTEGQTNLRRKMMQREEKSSSKANIILHPLSFFMAS